MDKKTKYTEKEELKTKTKIWYLDTEVSEEILAIEKFKNKDLEIHYPFGRDYGPKYKNIESIEYIGFGGKIPRGCSNSPSRGLGFTKTLSPIFYDLDTRFKITKVVIKSIAKDKLDKKSKTLTLSASTLDKLFIAFKAHFDQHSQNTKSLTQKELAKVFPKDIKAQKTKYVKNSVYNFLKNNEEHYSDFSELDLSAIMDAVDEASSLADISEVKNMLKTRERIEERYIEDVISEYEQLMEQSSNTKALENKWQKFLKSHTWIFSYVLSLPVILHEDEAYVGGKRVTNTGGKVTDFLIKNDLSKNVAFVELKTHNTAIMSNKAYRGDDVYSPSSDLTGAINQVLNQRDNFQKEFYALKVKSAKSSGTTAADFISLSSQCVVLAGSIEKLDEAKLDSFELFRGNSKDVLIITFDELLARLKNLLSIMTAKT